MNTGAFMHDLLDWIDNNLDSRLDIESVARRSGYSKWHLQRLLKNIRATLSPGTFARKSCKNPWSA